MPHAEWTVPADHPALAGHFPGRPIVPGVVLLDRVILLLKGAQGRQPGWQVVRAKFLRPVVPGETLELHCEPTATGAWAFHIRCGTDAVAAGVLQAPGA